MAPIEGEVRGLRCGSYGEMVNQTFVICPRCKQGRWVFSQVTRKKTFTGLCAECSRKVIKEALAPYKSIFWAAQLHGKVSVRAENAILRAYQQGYLKKPITELTDKELLYVRGIGLKSLVEIREALRP